MTDALTRATDAIDKAMSIANEIIDAAISAAEAPPPASPIQAHGVRWTEEVREWIARLKRDHDAVLARLGDSGGTSTPEDMAAGRVAAYQRGFQVGARHTAETLEIWLGRLATPAQTSTASEQAGEAVMELAADTGRKARHIAYATGNGTDKAAMLRAEVAGLRAALATLSRGEAKEVDAMLPASWGGLDGHDPNATHHPEAGAPSREAIARIVEPFLFKCVDDLFADRIRAGCAEDEAKFVVECEYGARIRAALDKADAILALYPTPPALKASELGEDHSSVGIKPSPTDEGRAVAPTSEWYRDGRMLYTLEQHGWYRGKPEMRNRLTVVVGGGPGATEAEMDTLTDLLLDLLPAASVAPEARATSPCNLSAEGRSEVGEAEPSRPTEPFPVPLSTISEGWRPIETAPKDGTPFLAYIPQADWCVSLKPTVATLYWAPWENFASLLAERMGETEGDMGDWGPTHWMPIPAPPTPAQDAEGEG